MRPSEDIGLIKQTARGDQEAFGRLYERHGRVAYNLARYILRNEDEAEDTVQDAFVEVWRFASHFKPGNPRNWILRIVANKCFRKSRKKQRREELAKMADSKRNNECVRPEVEVERGEMVGRLRGLLDRLPAAEREVVALYYGAGLTQQEVAEALAMPQRTVSRKISDILTRLRGQLVRAGFAGATTWVTTRRIGETVCSGHAAPAGLAQRVLQAATTGAKASVRTSLASMGTLHLSSTLSCLAVGLVVLGAGAAVWWPGQTTADRDLRGGIVESEEAGAVTTGDARLELPLKWNFSKGPPDDLRCFWGEWRWKGDGRRGMAARGEAWIELPAGLPKTPIVVIMRCSIEEGVTNAKQGIYLVRDRHVLPRVLYLPKEQPSVKARLHEWRFYIWDGRHAGYTGQEPLSLVEYAHDTSDGALCFAHADLIIKSLEIRAVTLEEIPKEVRARDLRECDLFQKPERRLGYELGDPREFVELLP